MASFFQIQVFLLSCFMENYDISRQGYHDTHDTMENIDLDYGAAISAIAIETIARVATLKDTETLMEKYFI